MPASIDTIRFQLAMAFGQGAGAMVANHDALSMLLSTQGALISRAASDWEATQWALIAFARLLGQLAATHAAAHNSAVIRTQDITAYIDLLLDMCPCHDRSVPGRPATF